MREKIKEELSRKIRDAAGKYILELKLDLTVMPHINLESPKDKAHGDFASNIALQLSKQLKLAPRIIAEAIIKYFDPDCSWIKKKEIAGPGFINFYLHDSWLFEIIPEVIKQKKKYGSSDIGKNQKVMVEFVSANPTGPLHVGHGRGAVVGDVIANIMEFAGFSVTREFYINDTGNQMELLGLSAWIRYQELLGEEIKFPDNGYKGDYIKDIAKQFFAKYKDNYKRGAKEEYPGKTNIKIFSKFTGNYILKNIKEDLNIFGVKFDNWFTEKSLHESGQVKSAIEELRQKGYIYEQDGAQWFKSTVFGDDKDRVVITKENKTTYFAADIAYHRNKYERGFDKLIDIWGADHHGYIKRVKAVVEAFGHPYDSLDIIMIQLVSLMRNGVPVSMSKRDAEFVTLKEIIDEVGSDVSRFFFLMRSCDSDLEFDLELAKKESMENPVYYIQYAYARISSIFREMENQKIKLVPLSKIDFNELKEEHETELVKKLACFPGLLVQCAAAHEPHHLTKYLQELAGIFHGYYKKHKVLLPDQKGKMQARLYLVKSVKQVIENGLELMGVSLPEKM
ncbi:MAG: arginine--tRNA ligase [bacterium]|nr:arginine--tRNA ligase [bacterium]